MCKGVWIRRKGCMWDAEVCDKTFEQFSDELQAFAEEDHGIATPYCITRYVAGIPVDIWYDENFGAYEPAPSGVCQDYGEILKGMLFICDHDRETGKAIDLTDEMIEKVLAEYKVIDPDAKEMDSYRDIFGEKYILFVLMMIGFKEIHYKVWNEEECEEGTEEAIA